MEKPSTLHLKKIIQVGVLFCISILIVPLHAQYVPPAAASTTTFDVHDYQAKADGNPHDTQAIQAAIDACSTAGGGIVLFPDGTYNSGTLVIKDNVTLRLSDGAIIKGVDKFDVDNYPELPMGSLDRDNGRTPSVYALISADGAKNIAIEGNGIIDANSDAFYSHGTNEGNPNHVRPRAVFLKGCKNVHIQDVTIRNSSLWTTHLALCEDVSIEGIKVTSNMYHYNDDGIDLDSCRNVTVTNCQVNTRDDAMVLKTAYPQPCENIVITKCKFQSRANAIKFGTHSLGPFRHVTISDCECTSKGSGIALETVDGGDIEDVTISGITIQSTHDAIFIRCGKRWDDFGFKDLPHPLPVGHFKNIKMSDIHATAREPILIVGVPGFPVENIDLENIEVAYPGGGSRAQAERKDIPEKEGDYPEASSFGILPAYGIFFRHVKGITLHGLTFTLKTSDARPPVVGDDMADVTIDGLQAHGYQDAPVLLNPVKSDDQTQ